MSKNHQEIKLVIRRCSIQEELRYLLSHMSPPDSYKAMGYSVVYPGNIKRFNAIRLSKNPNVWKRYCIKQVTKEYDLDFYSLLINRLKKDRLVIQESLQKLVALVPSKKFEGKNIYSASVYISRYGPGGYAFDTLPFKTYLQSFPDGKTKMERLVKCDHSNYWQIIVHEFAETLFYVAGLRTISNLGVRITDGLSALSDLELGQTAIDYKIKEGAIDELCRRIMPNYKLQPPQFSDRKTIESLKLIPDENLFEKILALGITKS